MKQARVNVYTEKAIRVTSFYDDFKGGVDKWKDSFYQLWRLQLTWSYAYRLELHETRRSGVFVDILCKPSYVDELVANMGEFGYRAITTESCNVGMVDGYELPDGIDYMEVDY